MSSKAYNFFVLFGCLLLLNCQQEEVNMKTVETDQYITVLGIAQDAGYPQLSCNKECCKEFHEGFEKARRVSCLGLVDQTAKKKWMFDATPDITSQLDQLNRVSFNSSKVVDGVFLTHAHIGHYTGLMYFGREVLGAKNVPVFVMPRMKEFLETNGPWSQLVSLENIELQELQDEKEVRLNENLTVTPFLVPHRDEFSETVGFRIKGQNKSALFIPDINKWQLWGKDIVEEVKKVDYAFLDATFFKEGEINRPMSEVPHPFITETADLFKNESTETKSKVIFIHFNHSNPAIFKNHELKDSIQKLGFRFAEEGMNLSL